MAANPGPQFSIGTNFSNLPYELRRLIWLATFEPRLLCLHPHQYGSLKLADGRIDRKGTHEFAVEFPFTAIDLEEPSSAVYTQHEVLVTKELDRLGSLAWERDEYSRQFGYRPFIRGAQGPVALYVCHESRKLGMQRYQLAFPPTYSQVKNSFLQSPTWTMATFSRLTIGNEPTDEVKFHIGDERTWIDFKRDYIVVDTLSRNIYHEGARMIDNPLTLIAHFAGEDFRKVKNLIIGGGRLRSRHERTINSTFSHFFMRRQLESFLFDDLEELAIDDTYGGVAPASEHDTASFSRLIKNIEMTIANSSNNMTANVYSWNSRHD